MSSMSQVSEMSVAQPGPGQPGGKKADVKIIVMSVIVLGLLAYLIYSILQGSTGASEAQGGDGGDGGDGNGAYSGGGRRKKTTTTTTTTETTVIKPTPKPHERPYAFIFCTVGPSLESSQQLTTAPVCDFIVYTDVVMYDSKVGAHDDPVSYAVFLQMAKEYQKVLAWEGYPYPDEAEKLREFGISFAADDLSQLDQSLRSGSLGDIWTTYGILTAGVASYSRGAVASDSGNVNLLKNIMRSIDRLLQTARRGNNTVLKTTFLGVQLNGVTSSSKYDVAAMNEFKSIAKVDVLILVSHLLRPQLAGRCVIQALTRYRGEVKDAAAPPTMQRLVSVVNKTMPFRVALSFTMSLFLFEPKGGLKDSTGYGNECDLYYELDYSETCSVKEDDVKIVNRLNSSATAAKKSSNVFMVFDDVTTTRYKMRMAIEDARKKEVSLVWAVYDVQNDAMSCRNGAKTKEVTYKRFAVIREEMEKDYAGRKEHGRRH